MVWTQGNLCRWLITCLLQEADQEWPNDAREEKKQHCKNPLGKAAKISTWQGIIVSIVKVYSERTNPTLWQALRGVPSNFRFQMWLPENRWSILPVLECLLTAHLRFLSNQEALWGGHFKWGNANPCQFSISPTTDLDQSLELCGDPRSLTLGHPKDVFGVAAPTWRWKHKWGV